MFDFYDPKVACCPATSAEVVAIPYALKVMDLAVCNIAVTQHSALCVVLTCCAFSLTP